MNKKNGCHGPQPHNWAISKQLVQSETLFLTSAASAHHLHIILTVMSWRLLFCDCFQDPVCREPWFGTNQKHTIFVHAKCKQSQESISPMVPYPVRRCLVHNTLGVQQFLADFFWHPKRPGAWPRSFAAERQVEKCIKDLSSRFNLSTLCQVNRLRHGLNGSMKSWINRNLWWQGQYMGKCHTLITKGAWKIG